MSLTTLLDSVLDVTARPEARARALSALNSLLLEITTSWDYPQDLVEVSLAAPPGTTGYRSTAQIDLPSNVRRVEYAVAGGVPLEEISPRHALTSKGCARVNVFYRSGQTIVVNGQMDFDHVRIGYYRSYQPLIEGVEGSDSHWFLDLYEPMLVNGVAARVFMATGDDTSAGYYEQLYRAQRAVIQDDYKEV